MAVHLDWICAGWGAAGRFWCAFESAALHAPSVAIASSHCMHKLVYSYFGTLARASLDTSLFASLSRRRGFGRGSRRWVRRRIPRGDPAPPAAVETSAGGGTAAAGGPGGAAAAGGEAAAVLCKTTKSDQEGHTPKGRDESGST
jgi:hypothetical protein